MTPHDHLSPVFGCSLCIESDRSAWAKSVYDKWIKTYKFPKCKSCGGKTKAFGYDAAKGSVEVYTGCSRADAEDTGCSDCDFNILIQ